MTDKYDERAAKVWKEVCTTPMVNETGSGYTSIIAAALREAVRVAVIEASLDMTQGITKIMDQAMAAEYIKFKKQAKAAAYAEAAKIAEMSPPSWHGPVIASYIRALIENETPRLKYDGRYTDIIGEDNRQWTIISHYIGPDGFDYHKSSRMLKGLIKLGIVKAPL